MEQSKVNAAQKLMEHAFYGLVVPALLEAEVDLFADPEISKKMITCLEDRRVTVVELEPKHEHAFKVEAVIAAHEDLVDPKSAQLNVICALARMELPPSVLLACRADAEGLHWSVSAAGTLALPVGHPLAELAHGAAHLDLPRHTMMRNLDPREAFQAVRKIGRIWHVNGL
ncbi:hypothetical protein M0Q28_05245 [Patescibacteria group bacterium]|jgi:hypothetical protein|nr:hypothetical protein [Patescibacteria group bacterium]